MIRGVHLIVAAGLGLACSPARAPVDAGAARPQSAPAPVADPEVLRFDPGVTFRLRLHDAPDRLRLSVVLRETRLGAVVEVADYPPRQGRPRSDPPMVFARTTPLTRAQVAAFWAAEEDAGVWSVAASASEGTPSVELEARLGSRARGIQLAPDGAMALVAATRRLAQVEELEGHSKPHVAAIEGAPGEAIAVVSDPTRVVLLQDSPDGTRLTVSREGELVRVTRRLPLVTFVGRRHRRHVQWTQRDRWLPRDALEEALSRAAAAGIWELVDPASSSPFATRLVLHTEGRDLVLASPPGPDAPETFRALAPLRALSP
jgi:hypothetical protein